MIAIWLGLINWLSTYTLCEGYVFREAREWVKAHMPDKLGYLCTCQLCMGIWVGFLEAAIIHGGPIHGWYSIPANGLLYKAIGHLTLVLHKLGEKYGR